VNSSDESDILDEFFDIYGKYLELQRAIEVCRPYFYAAGGAKTVDDLIFIAREYATVINSLTARHRELLTSPHIMEWMGGQIGSIAEFSSNLFWPKPDNQDDQLLYADFSNYVLNALTSDNNTKPNLFHGREWHIVKHDESLSRVTLVCRNKDTLEWNGAYARWDEGRLCQVGFYENDVPIFIIHIYNEGACEVVCRPPPQELMLTTQNIDQVDSDNGDADDESNYEWGTTLAAALGGLVLTSIIKQSKSDKKQIKNRKVMQKQIV
jgi:hypothetical protein